MSESFEDVQNYTNDTVDVAIVSSTGEIELLEGVSVDSGDLQEIKSLQIQANNNNGAFKMASLALDENDQISTSRSLRLAAFTVRVAGCVVAGIFSTALTFGAALAVLAIPCGSAIVSGVQLLTEKEDDIALSSTSKALDAISCGIGNDHDCVNLLLDITADVIDASENMPEEVATGHKDSQQSIETEEPAAMVTEDQYGCDNPGLTEEEISICGQHKYKIQTVQYSLSSEGCKGPTIIEDEITYSIDFSSDTMLTTYGGEWRRIGPNTYEWASDAMGCNGGNKLIMQQNGYIIQCITKMSSTGITCTSERIFVLSDK